MSRRVSLPGADELFRTTGGTGLTSSSPRRQSAADAAPRVPGPAAEPESSEGGGGDGRSEPPARTADGREAAGERRSAAAASAPQERVVGRDPAAPAQGRRRGRSQGRRPSGRERHDEKITVYVSAEELMDLEHARLVLRGEHGLAVDRGRIVREAVAVVLADLEQRGDASILVRRLRGR
ncbi:hypothetical protein [Streptomyces sp. UNOC14_S4]|uniref:hypothetical protein n=1 Tax=Streptomyces sp. UNOC14_S4 TaxID=2872340 RepID=UPI001E4744C7|nr:hypothetical protein [Streptomyces sp. UNOC14_S4]MCC3768049.1 hypothetical protein [Streptomyces sp. UNOC14_S4]